MTELEADDGLATAAARAAGDARVEQVFICTPDKDLAQCVHGRRVVQFDRRAGLLRDADGVRARFGVGPESMVDYLALVGDAADGYPGLPGWGAKSASTVLARYGSLENIPADEADWTVRPRGAARLARTLRERREEALLFRRIATLRLDAPVFDSVDELRWAGPRPVFFDTCARLNAPGYFRRAGRRRPGGTPMLDARPGLGYPLLLQCDGTFLLRCGRKRVRPLASARRQSTEASDGGW